MKITNISPDRNNSLIAAVGDIHGMDTLLDALILSICFQAVADDFTPVFVFLGDVVDRGPGSCEAMTCVADTIALFPGSALILGNHDEWLLKFLRNELTQREFDVWLANGGHETLKSYFHESVFLHEFQEGMSAELRKRYPAHFEMLATSSDIVVYGDFAFVHAGIRPGVSLANQKERDIRWIREDFLSSAAKHEKIVVHGHSLTKSGLPEMRLNRVSLDTGAVATDRLSAGVFSGSQLSFATYTGRDENEEIVVYRQSLDKLSQE